MRLDDPVSSIKGVGEVVEAKLSKLGIVTIADLIDYYPRKYEDYSQVSSIDKLKPGVVTVRAVIKQSGSRYLRRGLNITEAIASDSTGSVRLIWFNQPYRSSSFDSTKEYYIRGEFALRRQRLSILNPSVELVSDFPVHSARIVPVYRSTKGLKSAQIRKLIASLLTEVRSLRETLPGWLVQQQNLISRAEAIEKLHFPNNLEDIKRSESRLGFEEVFRLTLAALMNKNDNEKDSAILIPFDESKARKFVHSLPFDLTDAQRKAIWQIYKDMEKSYPMNRLLEGDVGSGKTVVACMSALMVMNKGLQVAVMAPTEILARQHADTLSSLLKPMGFSKDVVLLVGSMSKKQKDIAREAISGEKAGLIVGTSALVQDEVSMNNLSLVIIDEQHRFGVDQRKTLQSKAGIMPHVLSMTATPIPRSLALTLYGELDLTIISDKPHDRLQTITRLISPNSKNPMYEHIHSEIDSGRQVFIVCPSIMESEERPVKSVVSTFDELKGGEFKNRKVGLLHGKLKNSEKEAVMKEFSEGKLDILVTTTVIEVGVDVPNASVMVIESPESFGLAQIHQLRGRVGRSNDQGYCYLVLSDSNKPSRRLQALTSKHSGFELAELDLEIRGPGAIYGTIQHGSLDLRIAKLTDVELISAARSAAQEFIDRKEKLSAYIELQRHVLQLRSVTNLN